MSDLIYRHDIRLNPLCQGACSMFEKNLLGMRLLELRKQSGLSQGDIAELLKITRTQVSDIENGKSGTSLERFAQLCEFYRVSADYLLGITDDPTWRGAE